MTDVEKKQETTEPATVMTDSEPQPITTTSPEPTCPKPETIDKDSDKGAPEEFSDAVDEMNIKTAQDLSQVISQLQGTVISTTTTTTTTSNKQEDVKPSSLEELDTSSINGEFPIKADIDNSHISAPSEPDSPRPRATDLKIATHFEQIRTSIDVPSDQNMADFVTPPTPGLAPPSAMMLDDNEHDDNNDGDLPKKSTAEEVVAEKITTSASTPVPVTVAATPAKPTTSAITLSNIDFDLVKPNFLTPRAQERYGKCL